MSISPTYFWFLALDALIAQTSLALVARRRGREAPWTISVSYEPPRFARSRLNWTEAFLLVILMPLGVLLVIAGAVIAITQKSETAWIAVTSLGFAFVFARGVFVSSCLAFAKLAGETKQPRSV